MCGCEQHQDKSAECTCICEEHGNFKLAKELAFSRYDTIVEIQRVTPEKIYRCLEEYAEHLWDATSWLCSCGEYFEDSRMGRRMHSKHRMTCVLLVAVVM